MFIYQLTRQQQTCLNTWLKFQCQGQTKIYKEHLQNLSNLNGLRCWRVPFQEEVVDLFLRVADMEHLKKYKHNPYQGYRHLSGAMVKGYASRKKVL